MQEIAAYLLLKIAGKLGTTDEITSVITAGGGTVDETALSTLLADVEGQDINTLLKSGMEKLKDVPMGGGGGGGSGGGAAVEAVVEEEKEVVEEEEIDMGGGMDMFGGEEAGDGDY